MNYKDYIPEDFSGIVSIYENDRLFFEEAYGYADRLTNVATLLILAS